MSTVQYVFTIEMGKVNWYRRLVNTFLLYILHEVLSPLDCISFLIRSRDAVHRPIKICYGRPNFIFYIFFAFSFTYHDYNLNSVAFSFNIILRRCTSYSRLNPTRLFVCSPRERIISHVELEAV